MNKKFYIELIFLVLIGCLTSLSLPPFNYLIINFFTFSLFLIFLIKKSKINKNKKLFFLYGWLFGFGYFISNLYWISISLTFDENFKFLIPISIILVPGFLALFYGLIAYLFVIFKSKKIVSSLFIFSLIFGSIEFLRGSIFTGFPWNLIGYSFSNYLEILNIITIIGTYSFNLFCITLFASPSVFILKDSRKDIAVCIALIITVISFFIYGSQNIEKLNKTKINQYDYKIRILSSNISIDRFYNNIDPVSAIEDLIQLSSPNKDEKTIFIWPEGILPGVSQEQLIQYDWLFKDKFNENHLLVIGINSKLKDSKNTKYFNSFSIFDHNLELVNSYNKINLVPFGEFLPFERFLKKIGFKTITNNYQSYSKGVDRNIIEINKNNFNLKILPLICYEIIFTKFVQKSELNTNLIVNISEDGWFGDSIGPYQHFAKTIFRAIEQNSFLIRSANKGITAIVDNKGNVIKKLNPNEAGNIELEVPLIKNEKKNKNDLIFFALLITYILTFLILKKNDY